MLKISPATQQSDGEGVAASIGPRLDRLPPTREVEGLIFLLAMAGFFEIFELSMTGTIALGLTQAGIFSATTDRTFELHGFASFVAAGFLGMFMGTMLFGWVADRFGRRPALVLSVATYSFSAVLMSFGRDPLAIDLARMVAGVGLGVQLVNTYISEIAPKDKRGRYVQFAAFVGSCSIPLLALLSLYAIPMSFFGFDGWRIIPLVGGVGGLLAAFILYFYLVESPRWLAVNNRAGAADAIVSIWEKAAIAKHGHLEEPVLRSNASTPTVKGKWTEIWSAPYAGRTLFLSVFHVLGVIAYYGFATWTPLLLVSRGITVTKSLAYVSVMAALTPVGPLISIVLADRIERKWQIVLSGAAIGAGGLMWSQAHDAAAIIVIGAVVALASSWYAGAIHTYQQELYPTQVRSRAVGFVYSWSRLTSIFVGYVVTWTLRLLGADAVFAILAATMLCAALLVATVGPRSNGRSLEEI